MVASELDMVSTHYEKVKLYLSKPHKETSVAEDTVPSTIADELEGISFSNDSE